MFGSKVLSTILLAVSAMQVSAAVVSERQSQTCVATCGSTCYWQEDIDAAVKQGYSYYQKGQTLGSDKYPHVYNDYEGFDFPDSGTYYEFPILSSFDVYTGGSPGADRVVFLGSNGNYEGSITHTGASETNGFVECKS